MVLKGIDLTAGLICSLICPRAAGREDLVSFGRRVAHSLGSGRHDATKEPRRDSFLATAFCEDDNIYIYVYISYCRVNMMNNLYVIFCEDDTICYVYTHDNIYIYTYYIDIDTYIYIYGTPPPMDPGLVRLTCIFQCFMLLFASWICVKIGGRVVHVYDTHACIQM